MCRGDFRSRAKMDAEFFQFMRIALVFTYVAANAFLPWRFKTKNLKISCFLRVTGGQGKVLSQWLLEERRELKEMIHFRPHLIHESLYFLAQKVEEKKGSPSIQ